MVSLLFDKTKVNVSLPARPVGFSNSHPTSLLVHRHPPQARIYGAPTSRLPSSSRLSLAWTANELSHLGQEKQFLAHLHDQPVAVFIGSLGLPIPICSNACARYVKQAVWTEVGSNLDPYAAITSDSIAFLAEV